MPILILSLAFCIVLWKFSTIAIMFEEASVDKVHIQLYQIHSNVLLIDGGYFLTLWIDIVGGS